MQETKKYDYLDALRGIAILLVLLSHVHYIGVPISEKFSLGLIGVPLFFMVSAYTLALSQSSKGFGDGWKKIFLTRRLFRIVPLFMLIILTTYILGSLGIFSALEALKDGIFTVPNLLAHLTFTYGFFVDGMNTFRLGEWSLFNEAIFYGLFVLVAPLLLRSLKASLWGALVAVCIYGGWNVVAMFLQNHHVIVHPGWTTYIYHFPFYHFVDFSLGFVLYHLYKKWGHLTRSLWIQYLVSAIFVGLSTLAVMLFVQGVYVNHIIWLLLFAGLVVALSRSLPMLKWVINSVSIYLGKISYSVYLLNLPILSLVGYCLPHTWNPVIRVVIALLVLVGICSLTYRYELYWIGRGSAFIKRYLDK